MAQEGLAGRHALVTGGARGLGAGMAQALAAAGAAVMIGDVLDDLAAETASGFGGQATPQFCESWWEVRYQVRWSDNVLTTGSLLAFADLWNDNCYFIQAP